MKMTVTPRLNFGSYFCSVEGHANTPQTDTRCHFCKGVMVRHIFTKESNSTMDGDPRTPLCQQHYEEWAAYLGLHELVVGHD